MSAGSKNIPGIIREGIQSCALVIDVDWSDRQSHRLLLPHRTQHRQSDQSIFGRICPRINNLVIRARRMRCTLFPACRQRQQYAQQQWNKHQLVKYPFHASVAFNHFSACARTFEGAVPPSLVRDATDASTVRTEKISAVIPASTLCMSCKLN